MVLQVKKVFRVWRIGIFLAVVVCLCIIVFRRFFTPLIVSVFVKYAVINIDILLNLLLYVFIFSSLILLGILYWMFWEDQRTKSKITKYISELVCRDYYKRDQKVAFDKIMGGFLAEAPGRRQLELDEFENGNVGTVIETYYEDREKEEDLFFKNNKFTGVHKLYYGNKKLKKSVCYKDGEYDGVYQTYYPDGNLHFEKHYIDGKLNGLHRSYDENGSLFFEIEYEDDVQHGLDKIYYKHGGIQYIDTYEHGERTKRKTYDESGELKFEHEF